MENASSSSEDLLVTTTESPFITVEVKHETQEVPENELDSSDSPYATLYSPASPELPENTNGSRKRKRSAQALESFKKKRAEMALLKKVLEPKREMTGLEYYFAGITETVSKLPPIQQARIRMDISALVGKAEIEQLEQNHDNYYMAPTQSNSTTLFEYGYEYGK